MSWNYRILRHDNFKGKHVWYGLHEVFYNDKGQPETYAEEPDAVGESIEDLVQSITLMLKDAKDCQKAIKTNKKNLISEKDFEKGGRYYLTLMKFEQDIIKEMDDATFESLLSPTTREANTKGNRRKPRTRNRSSRK